MRLLCVAPYVPHTRIGHAGGSYLHRYLDVLAAAASITLVAPATSDNRAATTESHPYSIHLTEIAQSGDSRVSVRVRNAALALSPGWPVLEGMRRSSDLRRLAAAADVIDVEYGQLLPIVPHLREWGADIVIATEHDVVSQAYARRAHEARPPWRQVLASQSKRIQRRETALLGQCDVVRVFSDKDKQLLRAMGLRTPVVETQLIGGGKTPDHIPGRNGPVLFTGAMWRRENQESAAWFVKEVWPRVRSAHQAAELVIAGSDPDAGTRSLANTPGVAVTGWVDDLASQYRHASVFVAPIVMGAGVKAKVFDAMRWGLPVVATPIGAEGIAEVAPKGCLARVTPRPEEFADTVIALLRDTRLRATIGERASRWVQTLPSFEESAAESLALFTDLHQRRRVK